MCGFNDLQSIVIDRIESRRHSFCAENAEWCGVNMLFSNNLAHCVAYMTICSFQQTAIPPFSIRAMGGADCRNGVLRVVPSDQCADKFGRRLVLVCRCADSRWRQIRVATLSRSIRQSSSRSAWASSAGAGPRCFGNRSNTMADDCSGLRLHCAIAPTPHVVGRTRIGYRFFLCWPMCCWYTSAACLRSASIYC